MVSRRSLLKGFATLASGSVAFAGYAFGVEPMWRLAVRRYALTPPGWPAGLRLRVAVLADIHAGEPYMSAERIGAIVARANALEPDIHLLLGDFTAGHRWQTRPVHDAQWAAELGKLASPLGTHAVLGNHDWWEDRASQRRGHGPILARTAMESHGITVYENDAVRLAKDGVPFWLAGLGDQLALVRSFRAREPDSGPGDARVASSGPSRTVRQGKRFQGVDDLPGTLAKITDAAPVILLAHEPDIFPHVPGRVSLTLSGHTHGGQVRFAGFSPVVPSRYGNRYAYGHVVEDKRHLIVSGGLGCSILPIRFGMPPEIVLVELGASI